MGLDNYILIAEIPNHRKEHRVGAAKLDPVVQAAVNSLSLEYSALKANGFSEDALRNTLLQDYMESGAYTNRGFKQFNNPGGITWSKNDPWATKGPEMAGNPGAYWAKYPDMDSYVKAKKRILLFKPGVPFNATTYADFAHRLKLNNYYGNESETSYLGKLQGAAQRLRLIQDFITDTQQKIVIPHTKEFPKWPIYVGGAVLGLFILKKLFD